MVIIPRHSYDFSLQMWVVVEKIKKLSFPSPADRLVWDTVEAALFTWKCLTDSYQH